MLTSCSFNKLFLVPDKLTLDQKIRTIDQTNKDSLIISFTPKNFQPNFIKQTGDTLKRLFNIESVTFKSKSGNTINGWWLRPNQNKKNITLLHYHGNAANLLWQVGAISPLVKKGFSVFMFDYSGFGFSGGKATRKNVLIDGLSALDYVKTFDEVKQGKLVIYGQSLGGNLAATVAAQRQNEIDGLVIEGAFSSNKDIAANMVKHAVGLGFIGRIFVKEGYSSKRNIKKVHKPALIIHSTDDKTIPFKMGKKIFENANSPKEFYEIKFCHICGPLNYAEEIAQKITKMVK